MSPYTLNDLEHRALDRGLAEVEFLAQKRLFGPAAKRFVTFRRALERHLEEEERETLPQLEAHGAGPEGLMQSVHEQHAGLTALLDALGHALEEEDYTGFCDGLDRLDHQLREHSQTEDALLHPALPGHTAAP